MAGFRASTLKDGNAYRPCIRNEAGEVIWHSEERCVNRDHSTSRGVSARDLATFALHAAVDQSAFEAMARSKPPECIRRSIWEMETWKATQAARQWALSIAPQVRKAMDLQKLATK